MYKSKQHVKVELKVMPVVFPPLPLSCTRCVDAEKTLEEERGSVFDIRPHYTEQSYTYEHKYKGIHIYVHII